MPGSKKTHITDLVKDIYGQGGFKAFFKGNGVNCIKIGPETSIKFFMFDFIKNWCS
jgi:solute carrier family 25 (mitochondrial phosphate transporter), member 23/24/25/41